MTADDSAMVRRMSRVCRTGLVLLACLLPFTLHGDPGEVFQQHCAACHGVQGQGATGIPNLVDNVWQYGGALEDIERSVTYGRQSIMPALGAPLGAEGLNQVVGYVQSLGGPVDASAEDLAAGETLFMMFCGSCHGEQGAGTPALGAPDLTDDVWLYGGDTATLRDVITNGRSNEMPGFADVLSAAETAELARYLQQQRYSSLVYEPLQPDAVERMKADYQASGIGRSNLVFGYVAKN